MSDPIRDALERLVKTSDIRDREWHDALRYARLVLSDDSRAALSAQPPALMAWPELPDCPEEWRTGDRKEELETGGYALADTVFARGLRLGYGYARQKLAAMNPNHQPENHQ
jgi:hypothetical protein